MVSSDENLEKPCNLFPSSTPTHSPPAKNSIPAGVDPPRPPPPHTHTTQKSSSDVPKDLKVSNTRKTQPKTRQALRAARDEIRSSLATSEKALEHLDVARRLEPVVLAGPRGDNLDPFLMALSKLDEASAFLSKHKNGLVAAAAAAESVATLRSDGNALALREFEATMRGASHHHQQQRDQQQQQRGLAVEAAERTTRQTTETMTTSKTVTAATQARLRSLARALVAGGGPEASSPSVAAFLSSEGEGKR